MDKAALYGKLNVAKVVIDGESVSVNIFSDVLVKEYPLVIKINGVEIRRYIVSETMLKEFIIGNLFSLGIVNNLSEIKSVSFKGNEVDIKLDPKALRRIPILTITPSCGEQVLPEISGDKLAINTKIRAENVLEAIKQMFTSSDVFKETGGTHVSSLFDIDTSRTLIVVEDLGRHNAADKVLGWGILRGVSFEKVAIVTSGRVFSDLVVKAFRIGTPIIISKSAPSYDAALSARKYGITLIGFARGNRFNVYSEPGRIVELENIVLED